MSKKEKSLSEYVEEGKKHGLRFKVEKFECPHCGKEIEIVVGVKSTKVE